MRVSDYSVRMGTLRDLQARLAAVAQAQLQQATGRRINSLADAPADAAQAIHMDSLVGDISAFRRAATLAATRLGAEDTVIQSARDLIQQAKDLARSVVNTDPGDPQRTEVNQQIQLIQDQLVALGNTQVGNDYIFGGARTTTPPFLTDGTYVGDQTVRRAAIDNGLTVDLNHAGDDLLGSSLQALNALQVQVNSGSSQQVEASMNGLDQASRDLLTHQAEVGARLGTVNATNQSLASRNAQILTQRDAVVGVDPAENALQVVSAQNALEQAYAVIGRVLGTGIVPYLS